MNKYIISIVVLLVVIFLGTYLLGKVDDASKSVSVDTNNPNSSVNGNRNQNQTSATPIEKKDVSWKFQKNLGDENATDVAVHVGNKTYDLGTYPGSCSALADTTLASGEISGVLCWFAGSGDEIGVFQSGASVVVRRREVEEGTAEVAGFKGPYRTILTI